MKWLIRDFFCRYGGRVWGEGNGEEGKEREFGVGNMIQRQSRSDFRFPENWKLGKLNMIFSSHVLLKIIMKIDQLLERLLCVMGM